MAELQLFPLPIIAFMNDQVVLWPSWGLRLDINDFQAFFCGDDESFLCRIGFFQAALLSEESGKRHHSLSAFFKFSTAASHSQYHRVPPRAARLFWRVERRG